MIPTIGHAAVLVGLALSAYAAVAFLLAARGGDGRLCGSGRRAVIGSFVAAAVGCAAMVVSLLAHDFSVLYVAENNATTTPPFISAISLWAALEGSILFWALLATGWATPRAVAPPRPAPAPHAVGRGRRWRSVNAFFFAVMTWPGNPFALTTPVAAEGLGPERPAPEPPVHGAPSAAAVPRLYRDGGAVRVRRRRAGHPAARRGVAAHRAALDARAVDLPDARHRRRGVVELRGARLGRLLGVGPGRERRPPAVADRHRVPPLGDGRRAPRRPADLDRALVIATFVLTLVGTFLTRSGVVASVHCFTQSAIGPWFLGGIVVALAGSAHAARLAPARAGRRRPAVRHRQPRVGLPAQQRPLPRPDLRGPLRHAAAAAGGRHERRHDQRRRAVVQPRDACRSSSRCCS